MAQFWYLNYTNGPNACARPESFNISTRNIIIGSSFALLGLTNFASHVLLSTIIIHNWKSAFAQFFIYKLILSMSFMAIGYMLIHFVMIIPCTITGCLFYPAWLMELLIGIFRTLEYGFFIAVLFVAIDRFFMFYLKKFGRFYQTVCHAINF